MEIEILTKNEIDLLNSPPSLNYQEKVYFFQISDMLIEDLTSRYKEENVAHYILFYGYFKHSNKFYEVSNNSDELVYIQQRYSLSKSQSNIPSRTVRAYKERIRKYFYINEYTEEIKLKLLDEAIYLSNNFVHRKKIFYSLVELSKKLKIEVPSYTELSQIISIAINSQKKNILNKLVPYINDKKLDVLDEFLEKDEDFKNRWKLSQYKRLEHSSNKNKMISSLARFTHLKSKFNITQSIIKEIGLNPKISAYHARWIEKSQVFQVKRKKDIESSFLLLSFVHYQYLIRNDNLIDRFVSIVQSAKNASLRLQKEASFKQEPNKNRIIQSFEESNLSIINEMNTILKNEALNASKKVTLVKELLEQKSNVLTGILSEKKLFESSIDNRYAFIEKKSKSLQGKLSGIVKAIEFDAPSSHKGIIEAINYFKSRDGDILKDAPRAFLREEEQTYIFEEGTFRVSLYKIFLFFHISDAIKSGRLNLKYSYRYQNFERYLIDKEEWKANKDVLLKSHDLEHLKDLDSFLEPICKKRTKPATHRVCIRPVKTLGIRPPIAVDIQPLLSKERDFIFA